MFNNNKKRLLQSPEAINPNLKLQRTVTMLEAEKTTEEITLEPREKILLDSFAKLVGRELDSRFQSFAQLELKPLKNEVVGVKNDIGSLKTEIETLKEEKRQLTQKLDSFEKQIHILDKESRDCNLVFYNVPKTNDIKQAVVDLCRNTLEVTNVVTIQRAIVLKQNRNHETLIILAKFDSSSMVDNILKNVRKLKGAGTRISISRDLSIDERSSRRVLLALKNKVKEQDTADKFRIKVVNNHIFIDNVKLTYNIRTNYFGNREVNGKAFLLEKFSFDFDNFLVNNNI